jgi:hypothetical protein
MSARYGALGGALRGRARDRRRLNTHHRADGGPPGAQVRLRYLPLRRRDPRHPHPAQRHPADLRARAHGIARGHDLVLHPGGGHAAELLDLPAGGASAYYLKAVMADRQLLDIYKGMTPFMYLQAICVLILYYFPGIVFTLPDLMYGK